MLEKIKNLPKTTKLIIGAGTALFAGIGITVLGVKKSKKADRPIENYGVDKNQLNNDVDKVVKESISKEEPKEVVVEVVGKANS